MKMNISLITIIIIIIIITIVVVVVVIIQSGKSRQTHPSPAMKTTGALLTTNGGVACGLPSIRTATLHSYANAECTVATGNDASNGAHN